tara:strand:- start:507 stop:680 length:174 start_codon:yes stop_codon:yes gene_type:complete
MNNRTHEYTDKEFAMMVKAASATFHARKGMMDVKYDAFNCAHLNEDAAPEDLSDYVG